MPVALHWLRVSIGRRRLLADGTRDDSREARYLATELRDDGAGVFSAFVLSPGSLGGDDNPYVPHVQMINDESVVNGILSGLRFLAFHARERAGAGGNALIRAQFHPVGRQHPLELVNNRSGFRDSLGARIVADAMVPSERVAPLDGLVSNGPDLVSTAYLLATDVFQEFGWAEAAQLTRDGGVRLRYWHREWQSHLQSWAAAAGITITEETLLG